MITKRIRKAAVIGGGVMGRGIAAHLANAGIPSVLLDIVPPNPGEGDDVEDPAFRNRFAVGAIERIKKDKPSLILTHNDVDLITPGNVEDHMSWLGDVDWIVEAVPEKMPIKQATFEKIQFYANPQAIITSNTSGLSIAKMIEGRSEDFKRRFMVTHFFNPVRYMKLLEIIPAEEADPAAVETMVSFGRDVLGKGIVFAKDTTNFIANRIGVHGMMTIMHLMGKYEMRIEDVDAIFGKPMGRPKSAVFRTADVVGLDTFVNVAQNCYDTLTEDEEREIFKVPAFMHKLVEKGWTGQKSGQGFMRKGKGGIEVVDFDTLQYRPRDKREFDSLSGAKGAPGERIKKVVTAEDQAAVFAREVTLRSLAYSARRLGEIADDVVNVDRAMRWGFNWDLGPFEVFDAIGVKWAVEKMKAHEIDYPAWLDEMVSKGNDSFYKWDGSTKKYYDYREHTYRPIEVDEREIEFEVLRRTSNNVVFENDGATFFDIGDGVGLLEFHTKMNSVDPDIITAMHQAVDEIEGNDWNGLVIANGAETFSVGANLLLVMMNAQAGNWDEISKMIDNFQQANQRMRYSVKPVVTAPAGMALGGGAEVVMGGNAVQAAAETYIGLVEVGVGLIPGGGGNLQLMRNVFGRHAANKDVDPLQFLQGIFLTIGMGKVATSAEEGREMGFLNEADGVSLNRGHLIRDAKERVLGMARTGFRPPRPTKFRLPGQSGIATVDAMLYSMQHNNQISEYDRHVGKKLAGVLCGGETTTNVLVTEDRLLELEREAFLSLCGEEKSQARMQHMLMNNKPLRN